MVHSVVWQGFRYRNQELNLWLSFGLGQSFYIYSYIATPQALYPPIIILCDKLSALSFEKPLNFLIPTVLPSKWNTIVVVDTLSIVKSVVKCCVMAICNCLLHHWPLQVAHVYKTGMGYPYNLERATLSRALASIELTYLLPYFCTKAMTDWKPLTGHLLQPPYCILQFESHGDHNIVDNRRLGPRRRWVDIRDLNKRSTYKIILLGKNSTTTLCFSRTALAQSVGHLIA